MNDQSIEKLKYDFRTAEQRWRPYWDEIKLYKTGDELEKPKYYVLDYFPYPSGDGLSVGHCRNYIPTCVDARFRRMTGYNVLHPMGWDAFGLPAENYAIKHGIHPRESTRLFCDTYRRQMKLVECSYDWEREINSTHPDYYRWTQWIFNLLYRRGLAYQAMGRQWWCPQCQTILANEQVEGGRCWRCESPVERKEVRQWYFKITEYAERLLDDLDLIDWPGPIKTMQRNWIGRSEGAEIGFQVDAPGAHGGAGEVRVFTTRPDTLFGVTYLVLAPEHPLVEMVTAPRERDRVRRYAAQATRKSDIDRMMTADDKSGVYTGSSARHPFTGRPVPIWIADYVLMEYGTGAIMGVPAHDERDHAFARQHGLEIIEVIRPDDPEEGAQDCFNGHGMIINSGEFSGLDSVEGCRRIVAALEQNGMGRHQVTYRMRDWLISRQRYWGAPIPIIHCQQCGAVPVPDNELPVRLPDTADFAPSGDGRAPLARVESWTAVRCPQCGKPAQRETDTMDGFACSSWYFLRYASPRCEEGPFDPAAVRYWLPVDTYVGGAEHAVMHLLYSRFWTKVLYDAGLVHFVEPFTQLRNQGMLLSAEDGRKMSKSRGNVVTPDEVIARYGTDALRAYVLFLGPFEAEVTWSEAGIKGVSRFLDRYWRLAQQVCAAEAGSFTEEASAREFERQRHQIIQRVTSDMERFRCNTAIAALMEFLNYLLSLSIESVPHDAWMRAVRTLTLLLAPIAPFVTEEVWRRIIKAEGSVHRQRWPEYDESAAQNEQITVIVQVNGRLRDRLRVAADMGETELTALALKSPHVQRHIGSKVVRRVVYAPPYLINVVA